MKITYSTEKLKIICSDVTKAKRYFGGDKVLAISLMSRMNALEQADSLNDIIVQKHFHFHNLINKNGRDLRGYYAIDVKGRKESWRIILQPLNHDEKPFVNTNIHEISKIVKIIKIEEVSNHYE